MRHGEPSGVHPEGHRRDLVAAAALDGDAARAAWSRWRSANDLERVDPASYRLLPQVYRNLVALGVDDPWLGRLRGIYRYHWYRNTLLAETAARVLTALERAGVETLVLKGAAVAVLHYGSLGARPMQDVDILVPRGAATRAMRSLREAGFTDDEEPPERDLALRHAAGFNAPDGRGIDLHWYALWQPTRDDDLWAGSVQLELGGVPTRALGPADQLVHVCAHGSLWNPIAPIRWAADSLLVLRSSAERLDWDRVVRSARDRRLTVVMTDALGYLRREFDAAVPSDVITALRVSRASRLERSAHHFSLRPPPSVSRSLTIHYDRYRRLRALGELGPDTSFTRFLTQTRGVDHAWQLPGHAVHKLREHRRRGNELTPSR